MTVCSPLTFLPTNQPSWLVQRLTFLCSTSGLKPLNVSLDSKGLLIISAGSQAPYLSLKLNSKAWLSCWCHFSFLCALLNSPVQCNMEDFIAVTERSSPETARLLQLDWSQNMRNWDNRGSRMPVTECDLLKASCYPSSSAKWFWNIYCD